MSHYSDEREQTSRLDDVLKDLRLNDATPADWDRAAAVAVVTALNEEKVSEQNDLDSYITSYVSPHDDTSSPGTIDTSGTISDGAFQGWNINDYRIVDANVGINVPSSPDYKFREDELIEEFRKYINTTYDGHYGQGGLQSSEVIVDRGHGMGFFLGNVDKYNGRYGKKGTPIDHRKDIVKIIHYGFLALYEHDRINGHTTD